MKIPVFVSCPTDLNPEQDKSRQLILRELEKLCLDPRALGRLDYPVSTPLQEVFVIASHCSGGIILGFEQYWVPEKSIFKRGIEGKETPQKEPLAFPTAWNNLEAGILYALKKPMLVFKEKSISGGIFGSGSHNLFIHTMPSNKTELDEGLQEVLLNWRSSVYQHYYNQ